MGGVVDSVESAASSVYDSVSGAVGGLVDSVEGAASRAYDNVSDVIGGVVDSVENAASAVYDSVAGAVSGVVGSVEDLFDAGPKAAAIAQTADTVAKTSDADLKKMSAADKVAMLKTLLSNGSLTPEALAAQKKLYANMDLDPDFKKRDDKHGDNVARALKGDKELEKARDGWDKTTDQQKVDSLKRVIAAQSKEYGFPPPEVVIEHNPPKNGIITNGYFDPSDGKLHLNMDSHSSINDFEKAVDLAVHENAHNYQDHLVADLKAGKIKPGDPDYTQATMFAVNSEPNGYIEAKTKADLPIYKKQPLEDHSWHTGPETASKILLNL